MDHLPLSEGKHIEIPYVIQEHHAYDGLGYLDFGGRMNPKSNRDYDTFNNISKLQAYLFFGLVIEVLQVPGIIVDKQDFIRTNEDGSLVITTSKLPSYLWLWALRVRKQLMTNKEKDKEAILAILNKARGTIPLGSVGGMFFETKELWDGDRLNLRSLVLIGVLVLAETLTACFEKNYDEMGPSWPVFWGFKEILVQKGWCPYEITLLSERSKIGNTGLYFVSTISRNRTREMHSLCLEEDCDAFRIDEIDYKTKHEKEGCSCQHIAADIDINEMILMGQIPLFTVTQLQEDGNCKIKVQAFRKGYIWGKTRYVALSHVWAHGLGNKDHNSLPQCQLLRLQRLCNDLYRLNGEDPIPFWIDTLGVPISDPYRTKALFQMVSTFKEADKVLVLDEGLLHTSMQGELQEPMIYIATSLWSRRLWTLQENLVSKNLYFRFTDGALHEGDLVNAKNYFIKHKAYTQAKLEEDIGGIREISRRGNGISLTADDFNWMTQKPRFWDIGMNAVWKAFKNDMVILNRYRHVMLRMKDYRRLPFLVPSLYWRSTSKLEDEAKCIAPFLGQDVKDIVCLEPDNRVPELLLKLKRVPTSVLFFEGQRVEEFGRRWLPKSFLGQFDKPILSSEEMATFCERGLHVKLFGCALKYEGNPFTANRITLEFEDGMLMELSFRPRTRHRPRPRLEDATAVTFSLDGKQLASASADGTIRLWNTATGKQVKRFKGRSRSVTAVAFSPDGKRLASASSDHTFGLWDTEKEEQIKNFEVDSDWVDAVAFSPDGKQLVSASDRGTVGLWDATTGEQVKKFEGHSRSVTAVAFSPDGKQLASASADMTVRLWDVATGEQVKLEGHSGHVAAVAFSHDGKRLASASWDQSVRLWDVVTGEQVKKLEAKSNGFNTISFSPDGRQLASADETVRLWDLATGEQVKEFVGHSLKVNAVAFLPGGKQLASVSSDGTIRVWDSEEIDNSSQLPFDGTHLFSKETALLFRTPESPFHWVILVSIKSMENGVAYSRFESNANLTPSLHMAPKRYDWQQTLTDTNPRVTARFIGEKDWVVG